MLSSAEKEELLLLVDGSFTDTEPLYTKKARQNGVRCAPHSHVVDSASRLMVSRFAVDAYRPAVGMSS